MKEEAIKVDAKIYTCETCNKQSQSIQEILWCEEKHNQKKCKHRSLFWTLLEGRLFGVTVRCTDCKQHIKSAYLSDLANETIESAEFQIKLFKLIKKYSNPSPK